MRRLLASSAAAALAVAAFATLASTGLAAATVSINGTAPNGGCGPVQPVNLAGPSRIVVHVSATAAENGPPSTGAVYTQILNASGGVLATGPTSYNAAAGGTYGVRVCTAPNSENPSQIQYSGDISILAPGTLLSTATGKAAIQGARHTMVWFTVSVKGGKATLRIDDALHKVHLGWSTGLAATLGPNRVEMTGHGATLQVVGRGVQQHITFHSPKYNVSGRVIRGAITLA
jgi:hypothetical protein